MLSHSISKGKVSDSELPPPMFIRSDSSICKKQDCKLNIFYCTFQMVCLYYTYTNDKAKTLCKLLHAVLYQLLILHFSIISPKRCLLKYGRYPHSMKLQCGGFFTFDNCFTSRDKKLIKTFYFIPRFSSDYLGLYLIKLFCFFLHL